jgi:hypothetical protein
MSFYNKSTTIKIRRLQMKSKIILGFMLLVGVLVFIAPTFVFAVSSPATTQIGSNIITQKNITPKPVSMAILVGQNFSISSFYADYENDAEGSRSWFIAHDPTKVENDLGTSIYNNTTSSTLPTKLDKPGVYFIKLNVSDLSGLTSFNKTSDDSATAIVRVHRIPTANFGTVTSGSAITISDYSFDIDAVSFPDHGIKSESWSSWYTDDGIVMAGKPTSYNVSRQLMISVTVTDYDGAQNTFTAPATSAPQNPTTLVVVPTKVYVNQTFAASDISFANSGVITQWSWSTTNNLLGNAKVNTDPNNKNYSIKFSAAAAAVPINLTVTNTVNRTASDSKNVQVVATSITGIDNLNKFQKETISLTATTTNVVPQDHDVTATIFQGTSQEATVLLDQTGTNSWGTSFTIPDTASAASYTVKYNVVYRATDEVLSSSTNSLTVVNPPSVDFTYRIKNGASYTAISGTNLNAYYGNIASETVSTQEVLTSYNTPVFLRKWQDHTGNVGSTSTFDQTYNQEAIITTDYQIQDNISKTKSSAFLWSNLASHTINIKQVIVTPNTPTGNVIPESSINLSADILNGTRNGIANPDLSVSVILFKQINGITTSVLSTRPLIYTSGNNYSLSYAFNSGTIPTDATHKYWAEFTVTSNRSNTIIAQQNQDIPIVSPQISGSSFDVIPFKTINIKADTILADPNLHWVRVKIPDADINLSTVIGNMVFDATTNTWSMNYTVPTVPATKSYNLYYEIVSKSTGQVVVSDTEILTIRPPTAIASNQAVVEVYDVVPLTVQTTNATPIDYTVTATVFNDTVDLVYDSNSQTWTYNLAIPKDYSLAYSVVYNVIPNARPNASVISITKPLTIHTWLNNAKFTDPLTNNSVTTLIPKHAYVFEIDSSINVQKAEIFSTLLKMDNRLFNISFPVIGTIETIEDTTVDTNRHKTWFIQTTFEYDYPFSVNANTILSNVINYKGTTYDGKIINYAPNPNVNISMQLDWSTLPQPKASRGYPLKFTSSADQTIGPIITSNVPLNHVDVNFKNSLVGTLVLSAPTYINNIYTYGSTIFQYTIPSNTILGTYPISLKAVATNQSFVLSSSTIQVVANNPPTGSLTFVNPIYQNDSPTFTINQSDPDGDALSVKVESSFNNGAYSTIKQWTGVPSGTQKVFSYGPLPAGAYIFRLTLDDGKGGTYIQTYSFSVLSLNIGGVVNHTSDWEGYRLQWNSRYPLLTRAANVFWAGEAFELVSNVTDTGTSLTKPSSVTATVVETGDTTSLLSSNKINYTGELLNTNFVHTLVDGSYTMRFTVTWNNGLTQTSDVPFVIQGNIFDVLVIQLRG